MAFALQALPRRTFYEPREVTASTVLRPAFGGPMQPLARKGDHWAFDVTVPAIDARACGMGLIADLTRAKREVVIMPVPDRSPARSYGSPVVNSNGLGGTTLSVRGLTPGVVIPKGKWLTIITASQRFLYLTAAAATANGSGVASLTLTQMLRRPTVDGAVIELATPKVEGFVPAGQQWSLGSLPAIGVQFTLEERE